MSGIKEPIVDVMTKLSAIQATNLEGQTNSLYVRIWNNQIEKAKLGGSYIFPRPAVFVEVINAAQFEILGLGYRAADLGFRLHIVHDYVNAEGTFEQDLEIFDLRDKVIVALSQYTPTACGPLNCVAEEQEYEHDNMYEYITDFVCNFIDSKGSPFDPDNGVMEEDINEDLTATSEVEIKTEEHPASSDPDYLIPVAPVRDENDFIIIVPKRQ